MFAWLVPWIITVPVCGPTGVVVVVVVGVVVGAKLLELPPPQAASVSINSAAAVIAAHRSIRERFVALFFGLHSSRPNAAPKEASIQFQFGFLPNGALDGAKLEIAVLLTVTVALPPAANDVGEAAQVTFTSAAGTEQVRFTVPLKPFVPATDTFSVPELVRVNESVCTLPLIEKSGAGGVVEAPDFHSETKL